MIMKIVVIGGTGLIGSKLVKMLRDHRHEAVAAAPNTGVNSITGEGLANALKGAAVVVDVTNAPSWEGETDQGLLRSLHDRPRDAVLRVHKANRRFFHRGQKGTLASRAHPAYGS
jgi:uncharacterized protein YbjT (DUF2867 family)